MPSIFTRIINGELPGRFVWSDERCVAFLSIEPFNTGHTLVVPREEVDHWIDLEADLAGHLIKVAQTIGQAQRVAFSPRRIGMVIAGDEVPHVHLHVVPMNSVAELSFEHADRHATPESLDAAAEAVRGALIELNATGVTT